MGVRWDSLRGHRPRLTSPCPPSAEPEDLQEALLDLTSENQHQIASPAHASACPHLPSSPSGPPFPSFLCRLGRDLQQPLLAGREGGWVGGDLPPGNVTLPGPRIAPGPKPRAWPGTGRGSKALRVGWPGRFLPPACIAGPPPHLTSYCIV